MLEELLKGKNPKEKIQNNLEELLILIPEIKPMINFDHKNPNHNLDVFNHTLKALEVSEDDFLIRLVLLLHDIGKPYVCTEKDGIRHYKGHEQKSKELAQKILKRLNYNKEFIEEVCMLIEKHDTLLTEETLIKNKKQAETILKIQYCDAYAHAPKTYKKRAEYLQKMLELLKEDQRKIDIDLHKLKR